MVIDCTPDKFIYSRYIYRYILYYKYSLKTYHVSIYGAVTS